MEAMQMIANPPFSILIYVTSKIAPFQTSILRCIGLTIKQAKLHVRLMRWDKNV